MPEPSPEERAAIDAALARLLAAERDARTRWWREGLAASLQSASSNVWSVSQGKKP